MALRLLAIRLLLSACAANLLLGISRSALSQQTEPPPATAPTPASAQNAPQPAVVTPKPPQKRSGPPCVTPEEASKSPNKETCVTAHVFDVVELSDGTRFLDVCPPATPDEQCRFTLLSLHEDRDDVGDLRRYRDQDVSVRGVVRVTHGRMGMVISHVRQFGGGPEKFRPNPRLLRDFNGQSERMPVRDPNLAPTGRHRSFMNPHDREAVPNLRKH